MKKNIYKKVLVLGATGFVGSYLINELLIKGYNVRCMIKYDDPKIIDLDSPNVETVRGDIREYSSLLEASYGMDTVINLAAILGDPNFQVNYDVHVIGTENIIRACEKNSISRVIAYSSISAGRSTSSHYGATKRESEKVLKNADVNFTIIRPEMIYGLGSRGINKIIYQVKAYPFIIPIVGNGKIIRQPVFVKDIVRLTVDIINNPNSYGKILNVGGKDKIEMKVLIYMVMKHYKIKKIMLPIPNKVAILIAFLVEKLIPHPPFTVDNMTGMTISTEFDYKKIEKNYGFQSIDLHKGLKETLTKIDECK